jgi:hypothetical protein
MIHKNGTMQLVLLKKEDDNAHFLGINSNELIKAYGVYWDREAQGKVHWQHGAYRGNIKNYIAKLDELIMAELARAKEDDEW